MAATRLIALHVNKGKTVAQCLADRPDYSQNAAKTNDGEFISSYECDPKTADEEFLLSKRQYQHITGRQQKNNIIAYQIRQSFKPGEITPEEANQVGYETAMRWTKGKHAFIVATHIDKSHIHNHIIYTTYSMEELGQRLGLKEATAYELVAKGHFDVVDVLGKRRVTKESFERWYASQTDYRTVEDQELDADIMASTYGLPEMARMLGVHRQTIYYIVANEDFELIKVGRYKRATKESFEKWYQNQTRYQLAEDRQERS